MTKISQEVINQRFIEFVDKLKERGIVKNDADFARSIGINPGQLSDIRAKVKNPTLKSGKNTTPSIITTTLMVYKTIDWLIADLDLLNEILKQDGNADAQKKVREFESYKKYAEKTIEAKNAEIEYYKQQLKDAGTSSAGS